MAKIKVEGQLVDVPDDATPEELDQIAQDFHVQTPAKPSMMKSLAEGFLAPVMPLAAAMKVPGAAEANARLFNQNAGQFGPAAAFEKLGGSVEDAANASLGNIENKLMGSAAGQKFPQATAAAAAIPLGLAEANTGFAKPSIVQQNLGTEAMLQGLPLAAKALVRKATPGMAEEILLRAPGGKMHPNAPDVVAANPEISQPGFYKKNFGAFADKVVGGFQALKSKAAALSNKLSGPLAKKSALDPADVLVKFGQEIQKMPEAAILDPIIGKKIDGINGTLKEYVRNAGKEGKLTVEDAVFLKQKIQDSIDSTLENKVPIASQRSLSNALMQTKKHMDTLLETAPAGVGKAAKAARTAQAGKYDAMKELKKVAGVADDATDSDVAKKMKAFLSDENKLNDPQIIQTLDDIEPELGTFARQLNAVRNDPFKAIGILLPLIGIGGGVGISASGWALENPKKAAVAMTVLAGLSALKSPRLVGAVIRGAAEPSARAAVNAAHLGAFTLPGLLKKKKED